MSKDTRFAKSPYELREGESEEDRSRRIEAYNISKFYEFFPDGTNQQLWNFMAETANGKNWEADVQKYLLRANPNIIQESSE